MSSNVFPSTMNGVNTFIRQLLSDVTLFCEHASGLKLRAYQKAVAQAIVSSVLQAQGMTFVVVFPRQSGKNELQAQIEAYLLCLLSPLDAEMVKVSPTWKPQSLNAMRRVERVLGRNLLTRALGFSKEQGYIYRLGRARLYFLSAAPTSNVVGATASTLLECDEAQDVSIEKWDREINPMAASTNATRVFWGTAWTAQTLLGRELRLARQLEAQDGKRRVFHIGAEEVIAEVPAYGKFVANEIARLGRMHPIVRTQYFSEEIEAHSGMFPAARLTLMQGEHMPQVRPQPGAVYAFLIDVAGEERQEVVEPSIPAEMQRDATALTVVHLDFSSLEDALLHAPTYRVVNRFLWTGEAHTRLYAQIKALAQTWQPRAVVIDATGLGAGLSSFLEKALPGVVRPFVFTQKSKSALAWGFLAVVETGRYREYIEPLKGEAQPNALSAEEAQRLARLQALFFAQARAAQMQVLPGPGQMVRWGVPPGMRVSEGHAALHDDLLISASLCATLDEMSWGEARSEVIHATDPLQELSF